MLMLYILFFLGVLVGLIILMDVPLFGMAVSAMIGLTAAAALRGESIDRMMRADIRGG
jgi:uncharacterized membrane protein